MPPTTRFFRFLAGALAFFALLAGNAGAAPFSYRVDIETPSPVRELLTQYLKIIELQSNGQMNLEQLRGVYRQTPQEIEKLVATEGYFSPRILPSLEQTSGLWVARFEVQLGEPVRVAAVDIGFDGVLSEPANDALRARLIAAWPLKQGQQFRQVEWDAAKRSLLQALVIDRFPTARISDSEALIDATEHSAKLSVQVNSGPVFTFGALDISGLERYSPTVVERLSPIQPGEEYSQKKLLDFQQKLQETGYFATAVVSIEPDPAAPKNVPVRVVVSEAQTKRISFGVGYSTDVGNRLTTEYQYVNLFNRGWRLKTALQLETRRQILNAEIHLPRTADGFDDSVSTAVERQNLQGELLRRYGAAATRAKTRGNIDTAVSLIYQFENQTLEGAPGDIRKALALNYSWTQRAVDSLLFPRDGYLINLQLGGAPKIFPDSENFVRGYARASYFRPVGKTDVFILRGEAGLVAAKSRRNIPSDFLFRTGGDQSVRGYSYQSIGVQEGDAIVGGRALGVISAEYAHYFTERWGAAVFYDAGGATDDREDFHLKHGYGIGARWRSPIGPLNLDVAYGEEAREYHIHFSIGVVF